MACLVHPVGWRLYHKRYWKTVFYTKQKYLPFFNLNNKIVRLMLYDILNKIFFRVRHKTLISLVGLNFSLDSKRGINLLVHYKLYWRTVFSEIRVGIYKSGCRAMYYNPKDHYYKRKKYKRLLNDFGKKKWYTLRGLIKDRVLDIEGKYHKYRKRVKLIPLILAAFKNNEYQNFIKKFFIFFTLLPYFYQLKLYLFRVINTRIPSNNFDLNIYFLAHNYAFFNPTDVLKAVPFMLYIKRFSPTKTLYTIVKIMKLFKVKYGLRGFKFLLAGRFTRRGRSIYKWRTLGGIKFSSKYANVSFYSLPLQGLYSKCIAKLWVCRK